MNNSIETNTNELFIIAVQVDLGEPDAGKTTDNPEAAAEDSQEEEMDEIDLLMLQERLGLEVEKQLEDLEAQGLTSKDLNRLLFLEGQRCCAETGLKVLFPTFNALHTADDRLGCCYYSWYSPKR